MIYYFLLLIYDFLIDLLKYLSISVDFLKPYATPIGVLVLLLRQNNIKKIISGHLPKKYRITTDTQLSHHEKQIIKLGGEPWSAPISKPYKLNIRRILLKRSMWSRMVRSIARFIKRLTKWRKRRMNKLKSRKFWLAILAVIIPVVNEQFNINLDTTTVVAIIGGLAAYILGESHIDAKRVGGNDNAPHIDDSEFVGTTAD